jgi:hypothetical protein
VLISVLAVTLIAGAAIASVTLLGRNKTQYPETWDPRVQYAVDFIEERKGQPFDHPVFIDFVPESEFSTEVGSQEDITQEDRDDAADQAASLRALGLVRGDVNLIDEQSTLLSSGTAAYYSPVTERVRVRGTELDVYAKAVVVHELIHAWQDQHTDLQRLERMSEPQQQDAFRAVVEGDAVDGEDAWVEELSTADQDLFDEQSKSKSEGATKGMSTVPDVLVAGFSAPYQFGPPIMNGVDGQGGQERVEQVLLKPPTNERQLLEPWLFLDGEGGYTESDVPGAGAEDDPDVIDSGSFGALFTYLMLAEQIDPHTAMAATDVLSGDGYRTTKRDGKVCVVARFTSEIGEDAALTEAFRAWGVAVPSATVTPSANAVDVETCDSGTATTEPAPAPGEPGSGRSSKVIQFPVVRVAVWASALEDDVLPEQAVCLGNAFVTQLTLDEIVGPALSDARLATIRTAAQRECL